MPDPHTFIDDGTQCLHLSIAGDPLTSICGATGPFTTPGAFNSNRPWCPACLALLPIGL